MMSRQSLKKHLIRALMIVPPVLFLVYFTTSLMTIRSLMGQSSSFHLDYANDLVQDYLAHEINLETLRLRNGLLTDSVPQLPLLSLEGTGEPLGTVEHNGQQVPFYLRSDVLVQRLPTFFANSKGLSALSYERHHEPVYWYHILDPEGEEIYASGNRPEGGKSAAYAMDRSLAGYRLEIIYNSFGPKQLYSVSRTKINFGVILLLFVLAILSGLLLTHSIRQKIVLAKQKTFFVSTVSHEFKTPLAIMKLAAETLEQKRFRTDEDEARFRNMLTNEINRLNLLVHKILSFNKIEMGQVQYHDQDMDLRDALAPSIDVFSARALADGVELAVEVDDLPCPIYGDADLIRHAIDNILDNAFKYRGDSTRIELSCSRTPTHIQVRVRDYGIGMAPEEIPHIQRSFYRIHDPILQGVRGSGLGLAISRYILNHAKAKLDVVSEPGKGSTFTIQFPCLAKV